MATEIKQHHYLIGGGVLLAVIVVLILWMRKKKIAAMAHLDAIDGIETTNAGGATVTTDPSGTANGVSISIDPATGQTVGTHVFTNTGVVGPNAYTTPAENAALAATAQDNTQLLKSRVMSIVNSGYISDIKNNIPQTYHPSTGVSLTPAQIARVTNPNINPAWNTPLATLQQIAYSASLSQLPLMNAPTGGYTPTQYADNAINGVGRTAIINKLIGNA